MNSPKYSLSNESPPYTFGALITWLREQLQAIHEPLLDALSGKLAPSTPLTLEVVAGLCEAIEQLRRAAATNARCRPIQQVACHGLQAALLRCCAPIVESACRGLSSHRRVDALSRILYCATGATADELHRALGSNAHSYERRKVVNAEEILALPGLLQGEPDFVGLYGDPADATFSFRQLCARLLQDLSAERARAAGLTEPIRAQLLLADTREDHREIVVRISDVLSRPDFIDLYCCARAEAGMFDPREVQFEALTQRFAHLINKIFALEAERGPRLRNGRMKSRGELAPNSKRRVLQILGYLLAAATLPAGKDQPARCRGLEWPADRVTLLSIVDLPVIEACADLLRARHGGGLQSSDESFFSKVADLCDRLGPLWALAEELLANDGHATEWLPVRWPVLPGVDRPGADCTTPVERVRAQLYIARHRLLELADEANGSPPSLRHLQQLGPMASADAHPLAVLFRLLVRAEEASASRDPVHAYYDQLVMAYLTLASVRPPRIGAGIKIEFTHVQKGMRAFLHQLAPTQKNKLSTNAASTPRVHVPVCLRPFMIGYHRVRSQREGKAYFLSFSGAPITAAQLRFHLHRFATTYAPDLFPLGIGAHHPRHIVATDLCARYGLTQGSQLAKIALRDHEKTVVKSYVFLALPKDVVLDAVPCQVDAIQQALSEARAMEAAAATNAPQKRCRIPARGHYGARCGSIAIGRRSAAAGG